MPTPVDAGNEIVVPLFNAESAEKLVHIKWSQNLATREADYYSLTADNITTVYYMEAANVCSKTEGFLLLCRAWWTSLPC
jgi:hypothetical protein